MTIFAGTFFYLSAIEEGITLEQDRIQMVNLERINNRDSFTGVSAISELHSWERENLPLIFVGHELAFIPNFGVDVKYQVKPQEIGLMIELMQSK